MKAAIDKLKNNQGELVRKKERTISVNPKTCGPIINRFLIMGVWKMIG
jgi:hypothetical protein